MDWVAEAPDCQQDRPISVMVTILDGGPFSEEASRGQEMAAILEQLARSGAFEEIKDPLSSQREVREDRPLPGRVD